QPVERTRPVWEVPLIEGYRGDRSVLVCKVHHCMIDGVSGVQLLNVMFDPSPKPPPVPPPEGVLEAPPLPSSSTRLLRGARYTLMNGLRTAGAVGNLLRQPRRGPPPRGAGAQSTMGMGRLFPVPQPPPPVTHPASVLRHLAL